MIKVKETKKVLESMYNKLDNFLKTETVVGEPIEIGSIKLIPIITASFGLGGGFGEEAESNSGGGGGGLGCKISPDAILVVKDDNVEMLPVKSKNSLGQLIEKVPDLISKIDQNQEDEKKEKKKNKETDEKE